MKPEEAQIKLGAIALPVGATTIDIVCPWCRGGQNQDQAFAVTRTDDGLLYICYRASCPHSGFIPAYGSSEARSGTVCKPVREFHRPLKALPNRLRRVLESKYELDWDTQKGQEWKYDYTKDRLYMPVFDYMGYQAGAVVKRLSDDKSIPKTVLYGENGQYHRLHYPRLPEKPLVSAGNTLVVVEDIISAVKVSRILPCVALLGTHMSQDQACELASRYTQLVIALDPDAYGKALLMADKYGILFQDVSVLDMDQDPKDTPWVDLEQIFSRYVSS